MGGDQGVLTGPHSLILNYLKFSEDKIIHSRRAVSHYPQESIIDCRICRQLFIIQIIIIDTRVRTDILPPRVFYEGETSVHKFGDKVFKCDGF